jgi:hypothetical protein
MKLQSHDVFRKELKPGLSYKGKYRLVNARKQRARRIQEPKGSDRRRLKTTSERKFVI